jgi:hypothetical protein
MFTGFVWKEKLKGLKLRIKAWNKEKYENFSFHPSCLFFTP